MFPFNTSFLDQLLDVDWVQLFSILSLNYYFKQKSPKSNSIVDQLFNYLVLAFAGSIFVGKKTYTADPLFTKPFT